jgi:hypothetical protein
MGNSEGTESGYLAVQVETRNIQAGGEITGVIHFHVQKPIQAESLGLKFSGKESCCWEESNTVTNSDGSTSTDTRVYRGKSPIVKQRFPIFVFQDSQIAAGDYSFPFRIATPATLPESFQYEFWAVEAHIKYLLSGYLTSTTAEVKKTKTEVGVTGQMKEAIVSLQEAVSAEVSTMCCWRKGVVSLATNINKSAYVPGEICNLSVEVDNSKSQMNVNGVKATLFRTMRLRSDHLATTMIKLPVNERSMHQQIAAGEIIAGSTAIRIPLAIRDSNPKLSGANANTLRGKRIECIYTVVVKAEMAGCCMCCGQIPEITREITVYPMQLPAAEMPQVPYGWNPTIMPFAQFSAASEQGFKPSAPPLG